MEIIGKNQKASVGSSRFSVTESGSILLQVPRPLLTKIFGGDDVMTLIVYVTMPGRTGLPILKRRVFRDATT